MLQARQVQRLPRQAQVQSRREHQPSMGWNGQVSRSPARQRQLVAPPTVLVETYEVVVGRNGSSLTVAHHPPVSIAPS